MTQRASGRSIQIGCGVLFLVVTLLFSITAFVRYAERDLAWDHARRIEGIIHTIKPASMQPRGYETKHTIWIYTVQFEYSVDQDVFRVSQDVMNDFFIGQKVPVIYVPETPWIAKIPIPDDASLLPMGLLGCVAIPVFSLLVSIRAYRGLSHVSEKQKRKEKPAA